MASSPLEASQAALAQGNYPQAIALLQSICDLELDEALVTQAQQLLILAYEGAGSGTLAAELRQILATNPQAQHWLAQHPPAITQKETTGFTPFTTEINAEISADTGTEISTEISANLGSETSTEISLSNTTGFTPLVETPQPNQKSSQQLGQKPSQKSRPQSPKPPALPLKSNSTKKPLSQDSSRQTRLSSPTSSPLPTPTGGNPPETENLEPVALIPVPQRLPSLFTEDSPIPWRNGERAKSWTPLKGVKLKKSWLLEIAIALGVYWLINFVLGRFALVGALTNIALFCAFYQVLGKFWMIQLGTGVAFCWLLRAIVTLGMATINNILVNLAIIRLSPIQLFYRDPTYFLLGVVVVLAAASPWLWDFLLQKCYNLKPFSPNQLSTKSPEALKLLRSFCRQKNFPFPTLKILPTAAPVAFTYGNVPKNLRIVISQGLLDTLDDAEIATIYAGELGHIVNGDYALMSLTVLILQIPYTFYWQVAYWGEQLAEISHQKLPAYRNFLPTLVLGVSAIAANLSYSIFWLLRLPLLWISRLKTYYSDRSAASFTGNPNAVARSILKIAIGTTQELQRQGQTSWLLEGLELLTPLGYQQAALLGGSYRELNNNPTPLPNLQALLQWDCRNPHRQTLIWGYGHPLTGDRLVVLNRYAKHWKLEPELELPLTPPPKKQKFSLKTIQDWIANTKALPLLPRAAIYGVVIGLGLRSILWIMGAIGYQFYWIEIVWLFKNASPFHLGCMLIAGGVATFLLINHYFPDIKPSIAKTELHLGKLLTDPQAIPPKRNTARMTGRLLGRRGISNWLGQDLWLQAPQGLIRLNFLSALGSFGNLILSKNPRPSDLVNRQVTVLGWWRRGVIPWIDVETLRSPGTKATSGNYPIWATLLGLGAVLWGTYIIWQA